MNEATLNQGAFRYTGGISEVINMGSYNYLGFAENTGPCADEAVKYIDRYGLAACSPRTEYGRCSIGRTRGTRSGSRRIQRQLEQDMARYLEVEDAICFPMGFATNSMNIAALVGKVLQLCGHFSTSAFRDP
jgi:serine palmitoyltransferase